VKAINYISESIIVRRSAKKGRGVFARNRIGAGSVIEVAPVIVMSKQDRGHIDQTLLHDYIFEWGESHQECCMALGYVPLYNHSFKANCNYEMHFTRQTITITANREIRAGEELFINYNGDWDNNKPIWFEAK
jgi:uncharacterized protein